MAYNDFLVRTESEAELHISVGELLRILLSGYMPDGTAFDGLKILSSPAVTGEVSIDQATPGTTNGVVVNSIDAGSTIIGQVGLDQTTPGTTNGVVVNEVAAGAAIVGQVGIDQTIPGTTNGVATQNIDEAGAVYGIRHSVNRPLVVNVSHGEVIAEGNLADHIALRRFGYNGNVAVTRETVCSASALRTYLAAGERVQVTSSDAADDGAPAGNGARTVTITGLDDNYDVLTETVTMNGVANVLTDASFLRIECATVVTAGVTGYNEGLITVSNNADTTILEQINIGENASMCASYTVPAGYTAYITQAMATESSSKGCKFGFWMRTFGGLWTKKRAVVLLDNSIVLPMNIPMKLPEKTDIELRARALLAGAIVTAGFEGWIEAN